jgi:putative RecB family exonuclease
MDHLSASQMNLYFQCSLKYKFQYIQKLAKPFKASGLVFGSAIHSAISWFHKNQLAGRSVTLEKLYSIFAADWYGQKVESVIRFKEAETETACLLLGREILNLYYHQPRKQVKGTEIPFTVPLVNPENREHLGINLEGFIDLLEENDCIVEFKTSVRTMDLKDVNLQLTAYSYAYEMLYGKRPKNMRVVNFLKLKKPKMLSLEVKNGSVNHQRFFQLAKEALKGIRSGVFFPRHSWWCEGCEYVEPCRGWDGK